MIMADEEKQESSEKTEEKTETPEAKPEKKPAKKEKSEKKGKRVRTGRKHEHVKSENIYKVEGSAAKPSKQPCPRCGPGTWLADHKGRKYCGRCHYTIFEKRS
jgi:small subunit ribosomal protein S27Ae